MAVRGAIVQAFMLSILDIRRDKLLCCGIAGELVRDHHARSGVLLHNQLLQQALGGFGIAAGSVRLHRDDHNRQRINPVPTQSRDDQRPSLQSR